MHPPLVGQRLTHNFQISIHTRLSSTDNMASVETLLSNAGLPEMVQLNIVEDSRPTRMASALKKELELMATFNVFKNLREECDRGWVVYYKAWNKRRQPGYIFPGEEDPNPPHMWSLIEQELVQWDKESAQHYLDNLTEIIESPELLEKVSGYTREIWIYTNPEHRYVKGQEVVTAEEMKKDLISNADCLRNIVERLEKWEAQEARRATFASDEEYELAMIDEYNDYMNSFPEDPSDRYDYLW